MAVDITILDNSNAYETEKVRQTSEEGLNRASFQISETNEQPLLHIRRVRFVEGNERKTDDILTVNLLTGRISIYNVDASYQDVVNEALENAAKKITNVESPYIGAFNDK